MGGGGMLGIICGAIGGGGAAMLVVGGAGIVWSLSCGGRGAVVSSTKSNK